ncbi:MAG: hypothetical protein H2038_08695 [Brevundimonas sp.]|uniref:hypothetical protein n=1 Tax=Brevundimonas sp. TaxID=1871086 RepID=UPI00178D4817|nr:hypothetical protein [Brevundimonas sp.]MBA4804712.1 hypothetical protein [Brevundimonas sp.]
MVPYEWRAVINPWVQDADLARVLILRSSILWSYSHVEQKLTDVAIRCSMVPEYRDLRETPPFSSAARISYLRKVLATDGPLSRFQRLGTAILDRYEASRAIRNRMAHSDMKVLPRGPTTFDEIVIDGGRITHRISNYWPGQLEAVAVRAARFSRAVQHIHYVMFADDPIPSGANEVED